MKSTTLSIFLFMIGFVLIGTKINIAKADEKPTVPPFELISFEGKSFNQDDMTGKVTLFIFWAPWCGVCRAELPKAHRLHQEMAGKDFQIVSVGFHDSETNVSEYVKRHPKIFSFLSFYDKKDQVANRFGAQATPTFFLFDKDRQLVVPYRGGGLFDHPQFKKILNELL